MAGVLKSGQTLYKSLGNIVNNSTRDDLKNLTGKLLSGRILEIDQSGTPTNGYAQVQVLDEIQLGGANILVNVLPLFPNLKNYPLTNETVLVIALANREYKNNFNTLTFYYLSPLNLWNSNQSNPIPYPTETVTPVSQNKGILEVEAVGNPNKPTSSSNTTFTPGTYFNEDNIPNPTFPYEGDYIVDGRFGNSLRFGNTVANSNTSIENNWSSTGSIGDPITILTNKKHTEQPLFNSITEDINLDGSSAYFTSTQQIPIEVSSQNDYLSYDTPPTTPTQYNGEQIILNSGRLLFNSTSDHILLSSAKSINLNTVESVNIDARTKTVIQTPELYLGGVETSQPVVLGDDLVDLLSKILTDFEYLTGALQNQLGVPVGSPVAPTNLIAQAINNKIGSYKAELSNILSQTTKTV
tara:strand:- start:339 stop:1571 length:1233 start_codon:yes stop_codon:yes gene_type:complete